MNQRLMKLKHKIPLWSIGAVLIVSLYFMFKSIVRVSNVIGTRLFSKEVEILPFIFGNDNTVGYMELVIIGAVSIIAFLLSTRIERLKTLKMKFTLFLIPLLYFIFSLIGIGMSKIEVYVFPYFQSKMEVVLADETVIGKLLFKEFEGFYTLITLLPVILLIFLSMFMFQKFLAHQAVFIEKFTAYEFKAEWLRRFVQLESKSEAPDVLLGINIETNEQVVLPGADRALHTFIVGPVGAGKSAAIGLVKINQDLHYISKYINEFSKTVENEDYFTDGTLKNAFSGISVIDPSNDLCQKVYQLCKAHNIPEDMIYYLDPTNPKTPSINVMKGSAFKVAEELTQVLSDLSDNGGVGNFFFEQAQRIHLKNYVYLLKLHDEELSDTWRFDDLVTMYTNTNSVREMHLRLKERLEKLLDEYVEIEDIKSDEYLAKRDERNFLQNLQNLDAWFTRNIVPMVEKGPAGMVMTKRNEAGDIVYEDLQGRDIKGLENVLADLAINPLVNRVLFGHSDFDFDEHMRKGGILLVNTAKGELVDMSGVIGKIVLLKLQSASFRRTPELEAYHHIYVDEAPEYLYKSFKSFPAQCRKYKVIITTFQQTIAQLAGAFGEPYMDTLIGTMRNKVVFGDLPGYDAKYFSELFGESMEFDESETEQSVSPLQDNPMSRSGNSYSKVEKSNMSLTDLVYQGAFTFAAKIVVNNNPIPVQQIKADFVPKEEFEVAKIQVTDEAAEFFLNYHKGLANTIVQVEELEFEELEFEEVEHKGIEEPNIVADDTIKFGEQVQKIQSDVVERPNEKHVLYNATASENVEPTVIDFSLYKTVNNKELNESSSNIVTETEIKQKTVAKSSSAPVPVNPFFKPKQESPSEEQKDEEVKLVPKESTTVSKNPFLKPTEAVVEVVKESSVKNPFFKESVGNNAPNINANFVQSDISQKNIDFIATLEADVQKEVSKIEIDE